MILSRHLVRKFSYKILASSFSYNKSCTQGGALESTAMHSADMVAVRLLRDMKLSHGGTPSQCHQSSDGWYIERGREKWLEEER
jgi:predicted outer membrane repeat protein